MVFFFPEIISSESSSNDKENARSGIIFDEDGFILTSAQGMGHILYQKVGAIYDHLQMISIKMNELYAETYTFYTYVSKVISLRYTMKQIIILEECKST